MAYGAVERFHDPIGANRMAQGTALQGVLDPGGLMQDPKTREDFQAQLPETDLSLNQGGYDTLQQLQLLSQGGGGLSPAEQQLLASQQAMQSNIMASAQGARGVPTEVAQQQAQQQAQFLAAQQPQQLQLLRAQEQQAAGQQLAQAQLAQQQLRLQLAQEQQDQRMKEEAAYLAYQGNKQAGLVGLVGTVAGGIIGGGMGAKAGGSIAGGLAGQAGAGQAGSQLY